MESMFKKYVIITEREKMEMVAANLAIDMILLVFILSIQGITKCCPNHIL